MWKLSRRGFLAGTLGTLLGLKKTVDPMAFWRGAYPGRAITTVTLKKEGWLELDKKIMLTISRQQRAAMERYGVILRRFADGSERTAAERQLAQAPASESSTTSANGVSAESV